MDSRLSLAAALCALVLAPGAAAQRPGTVEVSGSARYSNFDNSLGLDNTIGWGGLVAVYVRPSLALELDVAPTSTDGPGEISAKHTSVRLRLVYNGPVSTRVHALLGGGVVRNRYGDPYDASDDGFSALLGLRYRLSDLLAMRFGMDADVMFHTASDSPFAFYTGNWSIHLGLSAQLNAGGGPQ